MPEKKREKSTTVKRSLNEKIQRNLGELRAHRQSSTEKNILSTSTGFSGSQNVSPTQKSKGRSRGERVKENFSPRRNDAENTYREQREPMENVYREHGETRVSPAMEAVKERIVDGGSVDFVFAHFPYWKLIEYMSVYSSAPSPVVVAYL